MRTMCRYGLLLIVFFSTFFLSGHLGLAAEIHTQSVMAGAGLFSVSFVGLTASASRFLTYVI